MLTYVWYAIALCSRFIASILAGTVILGKLPWRSEREVTYDYMRLTVVNGGSEVASAQGNLLELLEALPGLYALAELTEMTQGPPGSFLFEAIEFALKLGKVSVSSVLLFGSGLLLVLCLFIGVFTWVYAPAGGGALVVSLVAVVAFVLVIGPVPIGEVGITIHPLMGFWLHMGAIASGLVAMSIGF